MVGRARYGSGECRGEHANVTAGGLEVDLASLKNAKPADLYAAADAYGQLYKAYSEHATQWRSGTADRVHGSGWTGGAADAATKSLDATTARLQAADVELACIESTLRDHADTFTLAQSKLRQALADAAAKGLKVGEDGTVSWSASDNPYQAVDRADKQKAAAEEIGKRLGAALAEATRADQGLAADLKRFTGHATDKSGLDMKTASADKYLSDFGAMNTPGYQKDMPGKDATPTQVNSWWKGLDPAGQQWFIDHHPEAIGNLDGIPAVVRDQVNRAYLTKRYDELKGKARTKAEQEEFSKLDPVVRRLRDDMRNAGDGRPQDYLLGIGTEGQGRAIISFGNPDTATDISSYVPGITTYPSSLGPKSGWTPGTNEAENTLNLWRSATAKLPPGGSVASIVWLGYDPPGQDAGAASSAAGDKGATAYAKFLSGVRASHQGSEPPHITSIGHSYGSYVVGQATKLAAQPGAPFQRPDDVVFIGSPGVGVSKAADLGMPDHVWAGAAANDVVTHTPTKGDALVTLTSGPIVAWGAHELFNPDDGWYGTDPASAAFGGKRFSVDDGGDTTDVIGMHTKYLTPEHGGPSLDNIAGIVTRGCDVKLVEGR
ncbi:alpha/beta hydrolase [Kitasatospora sp. NPDC127111]|uniref:alpha/beta hydrolase n=1 Tax=Kitasatospora sp. NPDC127111 TaxID=3345363 RepID=UPI00364333BF